MNQQADPRYLFEAEGTSIHCYHNIIIIVFLLLLSEPLTSPSLQLAEHIPTATDNQMCLRADTWLLLQVSGDIDQCFPIRERRGTAGWSEPSLTVVRINGSTNNEYEKTLL